MAAPIQVQARQEIEATIQRIPTGTFLPLNKAIFERGYGDTMCPAIEFNRINPGFDAKFHLPTNTYQIRRK
jgi:hypothetical protein